MTIPDPAYSMDGNTHVFKSLVPYELERKGKLPYPLVLAINGRGTTQVIALENYKQAAASAEEVFKKPEILWPVGITVIGSGN